RPGIRFLSMAHCGIPASAAIHLLAPHDRMIRAHRAAGIARFVEGRQNLHCAPWITAEIVPLVGALPVRRQAFHRGMVGVCDMDRRPLNLRVAGEPGADKPAVPRPSILCVARRVDADKPAAGTDVSLKGGFLARIEDIAGRTGNTTTLYRAS